MKGLFTLFFSSFVIIGLFAQTIYYKESFDNGLPTDWAIEGAWDVGTNKDLSNGIFTIPEIGNGNLVAFNDGAQGGEHTDSGTLTTATFDLTMIEGPILLEFFTYFINGDFMGDDERAIVYISIDEGDTFSELLELEHSSEFAPRAIDISEYAGESIVIQFFYDDGDGWNFGWALDEISITDKITLIEEREYLLNVGISNVISEAQEGIGYIHEGFIINNGLTPITSFDIIMNDGIDFWSTSFTGLDVQFQEVQKYKMDIPIIVDGNKQVLVTIANVNGDAAADADETNNSATFTLNAYTDLHPDRGVLAEEATGTWCPFCPTGTAYIEELSKRFPDNFVAIAVHNQDPMANQEYDSALTSIYGFQGFPSVFLERNTFINPSDLPSEALPLMNETPVAAITVGAQISTDGISTSIQLDFLSNVSEAHNVAIIIAEDGVTGSDADRYFQANIYNNGDEGEFGGFELLPLFIPASFNVFNHVGRALVGGWSGTDLALDAPEYTTGMTDGWVFDEVTLPAGVDMNNLYLIGVLINRTTGQIVNATQASIFDAASNGLFDNVSTRGLFDATLADVYPNPVSDLADISLNLESAADVNITVINSLGQTMAARSYSNQVGAVSFQHDMSSFAEGMYMITITAGDRFITKKINKVN